ncbi:hypothetical protein SMD44_p20065 (plasmid) [Streptomyces alboflavus]|uniref:Uncharacterized protein n=1 Tax=Streptomyces alboflavus TaxID=67267 RepID=A0A291W4A3_9ACTN|nr:hypothetical protein SMD44_p20065 [Streptomyces alboflavus]
MITRPEPHGARARQNYYWRVRNHRTPLRADHACETWHIRHGHPGGAYSDLGHGLTPLEHHSPTLLTRRTCGRDDDQYRGGCLACDWEGSITAGPEHAAFNTAIEDAHDHAFPDWRSLPTTSHRAAPWDLHRNRVVWAQITAGYPGGWVERGAPLVVWARYRADLHQPPHGRRPRYELRIPKPRRDEAFVSNVQGAFF